MIWTPDVALLTRRLWGGGAERVMANLAIGLANRGLKVDLIVIESQQDSKKPFGPNVRIINLDIQAIRNQYIPFSTGFQSIKGIPKLVNYLKRVCPPVLVSATHFINEMTLIAKGIARVPTRIVVTEHTFLSKEIQLTEPQSAQFIPWALKLLYPLADEIVAVSAGVAKDLDSLIGSQHRKLIHVIYNSVVTPEIYQLAQVTITHPWFQQKDRPIVVGAGRFVRQKDFTTLLIAFAKVSKIKPARLVLLGDGGEMPRLQALVNNLAITDNVWMPGFVENPYPYLQQADVFALSSLWEGLPTVLIEALALGTPVISTNCHSGPAEVLQYGEYGRLVPVKDPDALAEGILETLEGDHRAAPASWIKNFTPDVVIDKYIDVLGIKDRVPLTLTSLDNDRIILPIPDLAISKAVSEIPLVSIIIPAHDAADLISEALTTVQQQTYDHWEVIVVEDGTEDGTEKIVQSFAYQVGQHRVQYIRHPSNQGISATRNTGIKASQGKYIALLDHDDLWHTCHLEKLISRLEQTSADFAFASAHFIEYGTGVPFGVHAPKEKEWLEFPSSLLNRVYIPVSAVVMKRTIFDIVGGFDSRLAKVEDLDYWLRCVEAGIRFEYIPEITNSYRQRNPKSLSSNKADILEWHARVLRKHRNLRAVPKHIKNCYLARYHLGVVRRNFTKNPLIAYEFLLWAIVVSPLGSLKAMHWFLLEKAGKVQRYA